MRVIPGIERKISSCSVTNENIDQAAAVPRFLQESPLRQLTCRHHSISYLNPVPSWSNLQQKTDPDTQARSQPFTIHIVRYLSCTLPVAVSEPLPRLQVAILCNFYKAWRNVSRKSTAVQICYCC